jgi:hypothetical protein
MPLALSVERLLAVFRPLQYRALGNKISYSLIITAYSISVLFTATVIFADIFMDIQVCELISLINAGKCFVSTFSCISFI